LGESRLATETIHRHLFIVIIIQQNVANASDGLLIFVQRAIILDAVEGVRGHRVAIGASEIDGQHDSKLGAASKVVQEGGLLLDFEFSELEIASLLL
jgi:Ni,Fe-hydrogenase III large subunit